MNNHVNIQHHDADDDNHNHNHHHHHHHHHHQQPKQKNHLLHCYSYFIVVSLQTWNESEGTWSKIVSRDTCVLWDWSHASCFPNKFYWWHVVASGGSCQQAHLCFLFGPDLYAVQNRTQQSSFEWHPFHFLCAKVWVSQCHPASPRCWFLWPNVTWYFFLCHRFCYSNFPSYIVIK